MLDHFLGIDVLGNRRRIWGKTNMMMKWPTVVATARTGKPAPRAIPSAAVSQIDAAVVSPAHHISAHEDHAAADEADSRHNLRGDTRRVEHDPVCRQHVHEAVFVKSLPNPALAHFWCRQR